MSIVEERGTTLTPGPSPATAGEGGEAQVAPAWLASELAGVVSATCHLRYGVLVPDGAMPGLVSHLQAWLHNVEQVCALAEDKDEETLPAPVAYVLRF